MPIQAQAEPISTDQETTNAPRLFNITEFARLVEVGILGRDERVELIGRVIITETKLYRRGKSITSTSIADVSIPVEALLG